MPIIRVFPRSTSLTPIDDYAFVGDPPLFRPEAGEVHVSCTFTWDIPAALRLQQAWQQYYPVVKIGGPAFGHHVPISFTPGRYVKQGVTFTSRGCNNHCPWCLVPEREGKLALLPITDGYIINDNNFLQTPVGHRLAVYQMLRRQRKYAVFAGGLQTSLVTDEIADELRGIKIDSVFLAADTTESIKSLRKAINKLSFLNRRKLRCYVMIGYNGENIKQAETRLEETWDAGALAFAQLYQPADKRIEYSKEWRALAKAWSRPALTYALHKQTVV